MKISEAKECIKVLYEKTDSVIALISERGIGKTSVYQQCASELGIGYINFYATSLEGLDFMGFPSNNQEKTTTTYLAPQFLPTHQAIEAGLFPSKGLLVIEEIKRVSSNAASVLHPLLLERTINGHCLGEGWKIGVTIIPDTMNARVNALDDAILDRFISIEISANLSDYIHYSKTNHYNDEVIRFLEQFPEMLLVVKKSENCGVLTKGATPRGWTKVQEIMNHCILEDHLLRDVISGVIGDSTCGAFWGFRRDKGVTIIPDIASILNSYEHVQNEIEHLLKTKRSDLISHIVTHVAQQAEDKPTHFKNLDSFIYQIPREYQIMFFKVIEDKRPDYFDLAILNMASFDEVSDDFVDMA